MKKKLEFKETHFEVLHRVQYLVATTLLIAQKLIFQLSKYVITNDFYLLNSINSVAMALNCV